MSYFVPELDSQLHTVIDYIRWGASRINQAEREGLLFLGHGTDNGWDEACQLVLASLYLPLESKPELLQSRLTQLEKNFVIEQLKRRIEQRVPLAYLTGEAWFCGLPFSVDERVLIPRSPIAELIEKHFSPWLVEPPQRILDLCTGSGCIGIACAYAFTQAEIQLSDISIDALAVAEANIAQHQLEDRVFAMQSDGLANLQGQRFDLIVTNPPYVDAEDMADRPAEYCKEPELALASGHDGLDFTRQLLLDACEHLSPNGILVCEVGNSWPALERAFPELPFTWLEFEHGGDGVFVLTEQQLREFSASLPARKFSD